MKALPYLNLVTHMGSWVGEILEGDTEVNYLTWIISSVATYFACFKD
jgi:hypothetical protein